ncbi:hypothetical protein [Streptomyces sp. MNU89]|uniref:hypothetical protein n=1 Tax=Streptomyces sp. MNU89 TaxID=2560025 RepID=UPI001E35B9AC|nr:hypothetical protein [Streptomyces sp. MNU89]MCC9743104.1 hypothetical protein [Streptomyces sp. MNU89]
MIVHGSRGRGWAVAGRLEPGRDGVRPVFDGFPELKSPEVVVLAPPTQSAPLPTPQVYLQYIYDADDWEDFTVEWVHQFGTWSGRPYVRVQRMGGAGDRGADVAACLSEQGTAGEWHCYQCKHYLKPLGQSDAFPEMVKIFVAKILGTYELPTRYVFVAPKIGTGLERLLLNPPQLKDEFFAAWDDKDSSSGPSPSSPRRCVQPWARWRRRRTSRCSKPGTSKRFSNCTLLPPTM